MWDMKEFLNNSLLCCLLLMFLWVFQQKFPLLYYFFVMKYSQIRLKNLAFCRPISMFAPSSFQIKQRTLFCKEVKLMEWKIVTLTMVGFHHSSACTRVINKNDDFWWKGCLIIEILVILGKKNFQNNSIMHDEIFFLKFKQLCSGSQSNKVVQRNLSL